MAHEAPHPSRKEHAETPLGPETHPAHPAAASSGMDLAPRHRAPLEAFAETGDVSVLTEETARAAGGAVYAAWREHKEGAQEKPQPPQGDPFSVPAALLEDAGIPLDFVSRYREAPRETLRTLYRLAAAPVAGLPEDRREEVRMARECALSCMAHLALEDPHAVREMFAALAVHEAYGMREVDALRTVYQKIFWECARACNPDFPDEPPSPRAAQSLPPRAADLSRAFLAFEEAARAITEGDHAWDVAANYLAVQALKEFARGIPDAASEDFFDLFNAGVEINLENFFSLCQWGGAAFSHIDCDLHAPFRVNKEYWGVWSSDLSHLYVLPAADGKKTGNEYLDALDRDARLLRMLLLFDVCEVCMDPKCQERRVIPDVFEETANTDIDTLLEEMRKAGDPLDNARQFGERTPEELQDFMTFHRAHFREGVERDLNISLEALSIEEQFYFLDYAKTVPWGEAERFKQFVRTYGIDGARTFLSLREDKGRGSVILELGTALLREEEARRLFAQYAELVAASERAGEVVRRAFAHTRPREACGTACQARIDALATKLRAFASSLLLTIYANAVLYQSWKGAVGVPTAQALEELEDVCGTSLLLAEVFRHGACEGALTPEDLGASFRRLQGPALVREKPHWVEKMRALIAKNYAHERAAFRAAVLRGWENALASEESVFFVLEFEDRIIAFDRFDFMRDEEGAPTGLYFGSFNVDTTNARGARLGSSLLSVSLGWAREEAARRKVPLIAHCDPYAFITEKYLREGFAAVAREDVAGKPSWRIAYDPARPWKSKQLSEQELEHHADAEREEKNIAVWRLPAGAPLPLARIDAHLAQGMALTRIVRNSEGERLVVLERR